MEVAIANALAAGTAPPSFDDPETRIPHTHHITMKDAKVSYPAPGVCPAYATPNTTTTGNHGHRAGIHYRQRRPGSLFEK